MLENKENRGSRDATESVEKAGVEANLVLLGVLRDHLGALERLVQKEIQVLSEYEAKSDRVVYVGRQAQKALLALQTALRDMNESLISTEQTS